MCVGLLSVKHRRRNIIFLGEAMHRTPLQHSEVLQGSFELAELEAVGSSLARDSALVVVAVSVERLKL